MRSINAYIVLKQFMSWGWKMMKDNCWRLSFEEFNWKYALTYKEKKENEINDSFINLFRFRNHTKLYKIFDYWNHILLSSKNY